MTMDMFTIDAATTAFIMKECTSRSSTSVLKGYARQTSSDLELQNRDHTLLISGDK